MIKERVERDDLRNVKVGGTVIFSLPTPQACAAAKSTAGWLKSYEGIDYTCKIETERSVFVYTRKS